MLNANQRRQYLQTKIKTARQEELVLMMLDGVIRFSEQGMQALEKNEIEAAHHALTRSQEIILELFHSLDRERGGEIAENLARLYGYSLQILVEANMRKTTERIPEVQNIFRELREGWAGAMEQVKPDTKAAPGETPASEPQAVETPLVSKPSSSTTYGPQAASKPATPAKPKLIKPIPKPGAPAEADRPRLSVQG